MHPPENETAVFPKRGDEKACAHIGRSLGQEGGQCSAQRSPGGNQEQIQNQVHTSTHGCQVLFKLELIVGGQINAPGSAQAGKGRPPGGHP